MRKRKTFVTKAPLFFGQDGFGRMDLGGSSKFRVVDTILTFVTHLFTGIGRAFGTGMR